MHILLNKNIYQFNILFFHYFTLSDKYIQSMNLYIYTDPEGFKRLGLGLDFNTLLLVCTTLASCLAFLISETNAFFNVINNKGKMSK